MSHTADKPPRKFTMVNVKTPRGAIKTGKFLRKETNDAGGNAWFVIQGPDKTEFKARPANVSLA